MNKRTWVMLGVLVLVLGGGLVGLRFAGQRAANAPAVANPPSQPAAQPRAPAPTTPARAREATGPERDLIDGRVIDGVTHDGIADAELVFVGDAGISTFLTGRDGSFAITPEATGASTLASISASGYLPYSAPVGFSAAHLTLTRGPAVHGVTLRLYPAVNYEGIVVDASGAPVAGVRVRRLGPPGEPALESPQDWTSGRDGRFTFQAEDGAVLEASRGTLRAWGLVDRTAVVMKKLTIHLGHAPPRDATITGWVRDHRGAPAAEIQVRATPSEYYTTAPSVVAATGADGKFTIAGVERIRYDLSADATDHLQAVRPDVLGGSRNVELRLDAGLLLAGQVVDQRGEPVASFTLIVQRHVGLEREAVTTVSVLDPRGRFAVRAAKGDYDVMISVPHHPRTTVSAVAGATNLRIVLGSGKILRGKVIAREGGAPIAGAFVGIAVPNPRVGMRSVYPVTATQSDGTFELEGLTSAPVKLTASAGRHAREETELPAGDNDARGPVTIALSEADPERRRRASGTAGIGIEVAPEPEAVRVVGVLPNSGAHDAGLAEGDLIIAVEGLPVSTLGYATAVAGIRGPAGTSVALTVRRNGRDRQRTVERRQLGP